MHPLGDLGGLYRDLYSDRRGAKSMLEKFDFQWETRQQERMEALVREVDRLRQVKSGESAGGGTTQELERLRFENSELKLPVAVIIRILEAKG